jgi:S-adenosylmethionine decarboxylase
VQEFTVSFFEGAEKKVELVVGPGSPNLLDLGDAFWRSACRAAGAEILSKVSTGEGAAYVLSESSLFVFERKMIMLTCGRTTLTDAVLALLEIVPPERIEMLIYQRKNEAYPHSQPTSFFEDVRVLGERLPGRAFRFGHEDEHHLYMFHLERPFRSEPDDVTVEILMHGLDESVRSHFCGIRGPKSEPLREATELDRILPGFEIDDHLFEPTGYSLNALRGDEYYTVHVTPEDHGSYASFETNHRFGSDPNEMIQRVVEVFRPRSYDLVLFDHAAKAAVDPRSYRLRAHVSQHLDCGYEVRFMSFSQPTTEIVPAVELPIAAGSRLEADG